MPLNVSGGNVNQKTAVQTWQQFKNAESPFKTKFNSLTNPQKSAALNTITNWDINAASPTVARENALFLAVALLYIIIGYLAREFIKNQG